MSHQSSLDTLINQLSQLLLGKEHTIKLVLASILAKGHILIEDLPGMGKTTLAQGLSRVLGLDFQRVQFTSDLLPGDVLGVSLFNTTTKDFEFRQGPVFTQVLLADEINRSSPKTQSALLEAMAENQVTVDGVTYALPEPFFVLATQNPSMQSGTFTLPESQLDRFMLRVTIGYPDELSERQLLMGNNPYHSLSTLKPVIDIETLTALQRQVHHVVLSDPLLDYLQRLIAHTRVSANFVHGLSPRGAMAWLECSKAWALINHRDFVTPDDLQQLMPWVLGHRLQPDSSIEEALALSSKIIDQVAVV